MEEDRDSIETRRIVVAVIQRGERVLIQKRPEHAHMGGYWEFPGGKIEPGENVGEAVARECREELNCEIQGTAIPEIVRYDYPEFPVEIHTVLCILREDQEPECRAAVEQRWVAWQELKDYSMPPANKELVEILVSRYASKSWESPD